MISYQLLDASFEFFASLLHRFLSTDNGDDITFLHAVGFRIGREDDTSSSQLANFANVDSVTTNQKAEVKKKENLVNDSEPETESSLRKLRDVPMMFRV